MEKKFIISIDQSTQGTKAILLDHQGSMVMRRDVPHRQIINEYGWVGHDPAEIARNVFAVTRMLVEDSGIDPGAVAAVAVANQRETVAAWNRETGEPICEAIVWQCNRATRIYRNIEEQGHYPIIQQLTGLVPSPFFSAGKITWMLDNIPGARELARAGKLCAGTMDSWVIYNLTGGKAHKTDVSNASRTQLFNIRSMQWDETLCGIFDVPMGILPQVCDTNACFGHTDLGGILPAPVPIRCAIGDNHGVLFAHGCLEKGSCMAGHGTGTCIMMNLAQDCRQSLHGVNTTVAWRIDGTTCYALEGVVNYAGAVITWLKDSLHIIDSAGETEALCREANDADRTYLVPAFTGIGAPYWDNDADACIIGMSRLTGRSEIVRAAVESIGYQVCDILQAMTEDAGIKATEIRMAGGPTNNAYLMQFQSDIMDTPAARGTYEELVAVGAGQIAGLAMGLYDPETLEKGRKLTHFTPRMDPQLRRSKLEGWHRAVSKSLSR